MSNSMLWAFSGCALCIIGAIVYLGYHEPAKHSGEAFSAEPESITAFLLEDGRVEWLEGENDLGQLASNSVNHRTVRIVSQLSHPMENIRVITGCGCTQVSNMKRQLAPGEECIMTVAYDTVGRAGDQNIRVVLASSGRLFTLAFVGHVSDKIVYKGARAVPASIVCQGVWNAPRIRDYVVTVKGISMQEDGGRPICEASSLRVRAEMLSRASNGEL